MKVNKIKKLFYINDNCFFNDDNEKNIFYESILSSYYYQLNEILIYDKFKEINSSYEFNEILSRNSAVDLKLDVGLQGGFSQCKKIAGMAEAFHATISTHNG